MVFCFPSHTVWKSEINVEKEFNKYIIVLKLLAVNHFLYYQKLKGIFSITLFNKYAI